MKPPEPDEAFWPNALLGAAPDAGTRSFLEHRPQRKPQIGALQWAILDSNQGPLPYQEGADAGG